MLEIHKTIFKKGVSFLDHPIKLSLKDVVFLINPKIVPEFETGHILL